MLRVSFLVLLAMALAATSAHARLDLSAQLLTSNNQLHPYPECQKIPFLLCDRVCDRCVCDRRAPQLAECTCAQWKPFGEELQKSEKLSTELEAVAKPVSKSVGGFIPYPECIEKCDECVICTAIYPIEAALCYCGKKTASNSKRPAIEYAEKLLAKLDVKPVSKSVGGFIPYPECIEKCDECVICTFIYPIEAALCYCGKKTASHSKRPAIEYAEKLSTELEVVAKPVSKSVGGFIPYPECIEKCDECVICTKIYPIEAALCYCGKKTASNSKRPAIEYAEKLLAKLDVVAKPIAKSVGGFIPYPECIEKCDECVICTLPLPIETALCYCGMKTKAESRALPVYI